MVVDDEISLTKLLKLMIERAFPGAIVVTVHSGDQAWDYIQANSNHLRFDLVLTDVRMPNGNGVVLMQRIKRFFPRTHIVAMSGLQEAGTEIADAFIPKPLDLNVLTNALKEVLGRNIA